MAWFKLDAEISGGVVDIFTMNFTAKKFNVILLHTLATAAKDHRLTTDNNATADYTWRRSLNGGADNTQVSQSYIDLNVGLNTLDAFCVLYGINITGEEKLFISFEVEASATGAATAPDRNEVTSKVDTSTNSGQYAEIDINNTLAGSYNTGSSFVILGTD